MATTKKKGAAAVKRAGRRRAAEFEALLKHAPAADYYVLKLYVTGTTPRSLQAISNVRALCDRYLAGHYDLEVVDIYQQPGAAVGAQIIAAPTLVKNQPEPPCRMVGDLSDTQRVLVGLNLVCASGAGTEGGTTKWVEL